MYYDVISQALDSVDYIIKNYFNDNDGYFITHDSQQKIPVINIYKVTQDNVVDGTDKFVVDIALGLYNRKDIDIETIEDHGRYFLSISCKKKELPKEYKQIIKQISTNFGRRTIEFKNRIEDVKVLDTPDSPGIIRLEVTTKDSDFRAKKIEL